MSFPSLLSFPLYPSSSVTNSSFVCVSIVDGSESLSFPTSVVIVSPVTPSTSSAIHAIFVNILLFAPAVPVTLHFICITSDSNVFPLYAGKLVVFPDFLVNVNVLFV